MRSLSPSLRREAGPAIYISRQRDPYRWVRHGYSLRAAAVPHSASVAETERELVKERTIAGLAAARARGGNGGGRKAAMTPDKIDTARKLLAAGDKPAKIAKLLQVGLSTFYRHCPGGAALPD